MTQDILNFLMNRGSLGAQIGDRLAAQDDPYAVKRLRTNPRFARNQSMQDFLGPLEHQQFTQEVTEADPFAGFAATSFAPAYSVGKQLGFAPGGTGDALTSRGGLEEILRAFAGFGRGLRF